MVTKPRVTAGERMKQVLIMRYMHNMTLEEIGNALGVTRERVRQIESKAFRIIRNNPEMREKSKDILSELNNR